MQWDEVFLDKMVDLGWVVIDGDWKKREDEQECKKSNYVDTSFILSLAVVAKSLWINQDALVN